MKNEKKAEEIAAQRMQLISPLLAEGIDPGKAKELKKAICEQTDLSERTLRRYVSAYRVAGFAGLRPHGKSQRGTTEAITPYLLEQASHPASPGSSQPQCRTNHPCTGMGRIGEAR